MPDLAFDLRFLRYAMLVLENGSFRRTAELLNLSQSTVSRRIQLLERRIGLQLFNRTKSGVRPTAAGERFIRDASFGASQLRQAIEAISKIQTGNAGELRVGVTTSLAGGYLGELFGAFRYRYPSIEVILTEGSSQENSAAVQSGRLDAAILLGTRRLPGCRVEDLSEEELYIAVPRAHPVTTREAVAWGDVQGETFLVSHAAAGPEMADCLVRQLSSPGFRPQISIQHVGRENILGMVSRGFGIALTTSSLRDVEYPGVSFHRIRGGEDVVPTSIVWLEANPNPALKFLLQMKEEHRRGAAVSSGKRGTQSLENPSA